MTIRRLMLVVMPLLFAASHTLPLARAADLQDTAALQGLHSAKGVFMIDVDNPGRVAHVLGTIEAADKGMSKQGVKPHIVVVVVGPTVAFLTKDRRGIPYKEERAVSEVQANIRKLDEKMGIRTEVCGVAMKGMDIRPSDLMPEVHPVGNGYISAIGWQAQGYALVPVY